MSTESPPPWWRRLATFAWSIPAGAGLAWFDLPIAAAIAVNGWRRLQEITGGERVFPLTADTSPWLLASLGAYHLDAPALALPGRLPGYPAVVALTWNIGVSPMEGALLVSRLAWVLLPAAIYLGGTRASGRVGAAVAATFAVGARPLAEAAGMINSQSLFNLLFALFVGLGPVLLEGERPWRRVAFGVAGGLLLVVKEQGVLTLGIGWLAAVAFAALRAEAGGRLRRAARDGALVIAGALPWVLVVLGLAWVEYHTDGRIPKLLLPASDFLDTRGWYNPFAGMPGTGMAPVVGTHTITVTSHIGAKALDVFQDSLDGLATATALGLVVALVLGDHRRRLEATWLALQLGPLGPALALGFFYPYHISFLVAPLTLLIAHGIGAALGTPLRRRWWWADVPARLGALVLLYQAIVAVRPTITEVRDWLAKLRANRDPHTAAAWLQVVDALASTTPPGAWVVSPESAATIDAGRAPVEVGRTPLRPSYVAARDGLPTCDVYAAYLPDKFFGTWESLRLQGEDRVPTGWTLHWRTAPDARVTAIIAKFPGTDPTSEACAPLDPVHPAALLAPPPKAPAAIPPGAKGPPLPHSQLK